MVVSGSIIRPARTMLAAGLRVLRAGRGGRRKQVLAFAPRVGVVGAVVRIGIDRLDEFQLEYLDLTHPHVVAALICVDPWWGPPKTDGVSGFLIGIAAHSLALIVQSGQYDTDYGRDIM